MKIIVIFLVLLINVELNGYELKPAPVDVVIPCHPKDIEVLDLAIEGIRTNGRNVRRIIVISKEKLTDQAEWFDEAHFPFNKESIADETIGMVLSQVGWIYQQLLKLYAPFVIPKISSNVFILDADTIFLNPISLVQKSGAGYLNFHNRIHRAYQSHMARLLPSLVTENQTLSGVTHCMLFQKEILEDLFAEVEAYHEVPFWKAFCRSIVFKESLSAASEYEIYFNYALARSDKILLRKLLFSDVNSIRHIETWRALKFTYISNHAYLRKNQPIKK